MQSVEGANFAGTNIEGANFYLVTFPPANPAPGASMTRTPQLFRLDASLAGETSVSRSVADTFEKVWRLEHPDGTVLHRDLGAAPVPFIDMTAVGARFVPAADRTPEQRAAVELAETLTDELVSSDAYLFAVPLYNWTNPASVQAWVDRIFTAAPLRAGEGEPIAGRPAVVVHSRGGGYGPGTPREGWDHAEPYLRRILEDVWKLDVTMVTAELTLAATVPAMADFKHLGAASLQAAHATAEDHARRIAELVAAGDPAVDLTPARATA
jgi:FMN-dependent NADH-azoreductase